jgi:hypothetical protein
LYRQGKRNRDINVDRIGIARQGKSRNRGAQPVLPAIVSANGIASVMRTVSEILGGLWQLFAIAVRMRLRLRSSYWRWRHETAFGSDPRRYTTRWQRFLAMIEYGRWVHRMKRANR